MKALKTLPKKLTFTNLSLGFALVVGTFLRLWNFPNTLQFLGDQGRDAIIVMNIFRHFHPVLIGPVTSIGDMYLGPLYYYMMVPFLWMTYPNPIGPAYAIAGLSILTIFLVYFLGKEIVGSRAALIGALLMSCAAVVITFARFSWNPNPAPFFSLILVWASYRFLTKNTWYVVLMSLCVAVLVQLHYVTLLAAAAAGLIWLIKLRATVLKPKKKELRKFILATISAIALFLFSLTPIVLFDFRHNFLNFHSLQKFMTQPSGTLTHPTDIFSALRVLRDMEGRTYHILWELFIGKNWDLNKIFTAIFLASLFLIFRNRKYQFRVGTQILLVYTIVGIVGLSFYQSPVFDHYIAYLFPVVLLLYGVVLDWFLKNRVGQIATVAFAANFVVWNTNHLPLKPIGWTLADIEKTSETITARVKPGEKYNLVLLTGTGDIEGMNYRYFLETTDKPPLEKEHWGEADTLFIINEDHVLKKVTDSPIYEIVVFPNKHTSEVYTIPNGPEITVLRR